MAQNFRGPPNGVPPLRFQNFFFLTPWAIGLVIPRGKTLGPRTFFGHLKHTRILSNPNSIRFYRKTLIHLDNKMRTLSMPQQDKDKKKKLDCTEIESTMLYAHCKINK